MEVKSVRENPELFRIFLKEIVDNVAICASSDNSQTDDNRYLELFLQDRFKESVNRLIDEMWEAYDIHSKTKHLHELQKKFPPGYVAWRPTTGEVPVNMLKGNYLTMLKAALTEKIDNDSKKIDSLKELLFKKLITIDESHKKIVKNAELMEDIYKDYQEIVNRDS